MSKYLILREYEKGIIVENKKRGSLLGEICFRYQWKKLVFCPRQNTVFSEDCLQDIIDKMKQLEKLRAGD